MTRPNRLLATKQETSPVIIVIKRQRRKPSRVQTINLKLSRDAREQRSMQLMHELQKRWPHVFVSDRRQQVPWKIGIINDLFTVMPEVSRTALRRAVGLYRYFVRLHYNLALVHGGDRYDLDGKPAGYVSPQHQETARQKLQSQKKGRKPA